MKKSYIIKPILIGLLVASVYLFLYFKFEFFGGAVLKAQDYSARVKYRIKPVPGETKDIVIISIDSRAYDWFDKKWPWPRIVYANLIYGLADYNPRIIALNLAFVGESQRKGEDDLLAQAIRDAGNVYVATYHDMEGYHHPPYEKFAEAVKGFGSTNKPGDKDSVIRRVKLFTSSVSNIILAYSFEFLVACDFMEIPLDNIDYDGKKLVAPSAGTVPAGNDGMVILNYEALLKDFTVVPILDLLQGRAEPEVFRDKVVIVGMTGEIFGDIHKTPLGLMPGAGIIADNILMLLRHSFIREVPEWIYLFIMFLLNIIIGVSAYRKSLFKGFISLLLFLAGFYLVSLFMLLSNLIWDFFSIPFVMVCTFVSVNLPKLTDSMKEALFLKKRVIKDKLTGLPSFHYLQVRLKDDLDNAVKDNKELSLVIFKISNRAEEILKQSAGLIKKHSRKTRHMDFVSRYSEEKFCSVLLNTSIEGARNYAERIKNVLEGRMKGIKISFGIASYPAVKPDSSREFIECAERDLSE